MSKLYKNGIQVTQRVTSICKARPSDGILNVPTVTNAFFDLIKRERF